jgi:hypothetical protein
MTLTTLKRLPPVSLAQSFGSWEGILH